MEILIKQKMDFTWATPGCGETGSSGRSVRFGIGEARFECPIGHLTAWVAFGKSVDLFELQLPY